MSGLGEYHNDYGSKPEEEGPHWPTEEELKHAPPAVEPELPFDEATKKRLLYLKYLVEKEIVSEDLE